MRGSGGKRGVLWAEYARSSFLGGGSLIAAVLFAFFLLLAPSTAWANPVQYVDDIVDCPGTEITVTDISSRNTTFEVMGGDVTYGHGASVWPGTESCYYFECHGDNQDKTCIRFTSTRCGYTWDNRPVDLVFTCKGTDGQGRLLEWYDSGGYTNPGMGAQFEFMGWNTNI